MKLTDTAAKKAKPEANRPQDTGRLGMNATDLIKTQQDAAELVMLQFAIFGYFRNYFLSDNNGRMMGLPLLETVGATSPHHQNNF